MNKYLEKITELEEYDEGLLKSANRVHRTARAGVKLTQRVSRAEKLVETAFDVNDAHEKYKSVNKKYKKFKTKKISRDT